MSSALTDSDCMPFGKYKGTKMEQVPADYLDWLLDQEWIDDWPDVQAYIETHSDVIEQELNEQGKL